MLFLPMRCFLRFCKKLRSSSGGPPSPWFSGASGSGSRRFGGFASGQGSVEPTSGAVTMSGSVTIQRFISSRVFSRRVAYQAPVVGRPSSSAGYQPSWHLRSCLHPQVWGIGR